MCYRSKAGVLSRKPIDFLFGNIIQNAGCRQTCSNCGEFPVGYAYNNVPFSPVNYAVCYIHMITLIKEAWLTFN